MFKCLLTIRGRYEFLLPPNKVPGKSCFQSYLSVCLFMGDGTMWPLPMMHWTSLYPPPPCTHTHTHVQPCPLSGQGNLQEHVTCYLTGQDPFRGDLFKLVHFRTPPASADTQLARVGGTHPIGMLSCFCCVYFRRKQ